MKKAKPPLDDQDLGASSWADHSNRFPSDILLREPGRDWAIFERRGKAEAIWCRRRDGVLVYASQTGALADEGYVEVDGEPVDVVELVHLYAEPEVTEEEES